VWAASKKGWTTLEFQNQRFEDYATPWEKSFSPLAGKQLAKIGKPLFPVVDRMGTVGGYISLDVKACYLRRCHGQGLLCRDGEAQTWVPSGVRRGCRRSSAGRERRSAVRQGLRLPL
jgi:hypothetical protein